MVAALTLPLVGDEAYYWFWGQHLQLSYFDHPGMVAWLAALGDFFPFLPKWTSARIIFVFLSTASFLIWLKVFLLRRKNQKSDNIVKELYVFSAFYLLNPFLGLGGIFITPDSPLLFFWGLAAYFVVRIISEGKNKDYIWLGISLGLGFCSKYHIVLFPIVTLIALFFEKNLKLFFSKKIFLTVLSGLFFSLPVLIWNYQNDFSSFKFQLDHGLNAPTSYQLWWTTSYLAGQILVFNPVLIFSLLFKFEKSLFKISALGQWLFFLYSSFKAKVEANWPMTSHAAGLIDLNMQNKKVIRYSLAYYVALWFAFTIFIFSDLGQKKLALLPTSLTVNDIAQDIQQYKPLYGPTYQMSSLLSLYTGSTIYKLQGLSRYDFFDSLPQSAPKETHFYVMKYSNTEWPLNYSQYTKVKMTEFPKYKLEVYEFRRE